MVFRHITVRQLADKLLGLCAPASSQLKAALNIVDIPVEAPYRRRNLSGQWPEAVSGATILNNVRLRVSATTREVAWMSKVLFRADEKGNALPMHMTGITETFVGDDRTEKSATIYTEYVGEDPKRSRKSRNTTVGPVEITA